MQGLNQTESSNDSTNGSIGSDSDTESRKDNRTRNEGKIIINKKKKLMKVPRMDQFAKKKKAEAESLEEEFERVQKIFESSCEVLVKKEVASPLVPILLEKFLLIEPSQYAQCTHEIIETIELYRTRT